MKRLIVFLLINILVGSIYSQKSTPPYSFFCAGHTYGNPNGYHFGLHEPFVDYINTINNYPNMKMGFLTGDVVYNSTAEYWDSAQIDMNKFNKPLYIAAGNHDVGPEFTDRFGDYYYSFTKNNDLFIILSVSQSFWNITGNQLEFLINTLDENYENVNNIFILLHELIWWSPTNQYQDVIINYVPDFPGETNFESEIKPLLLSYPNPIILFAGDLGATTAVSFVMYDQFENITLIASGMGGGVNDNIIITDVYHDHIEYHLIALNGNDPNALGELIDYSIILPTYIAKETKLNIYPNPASDFIHIQLSDASSLLKNNTIRIINSLGQILEEFPLNKINTTVNISKYPKGLYFFTIYTNNEIKETYKLMIE